MTLYPKYRSDIDGLRAIAVLSVVAFHAFPKVVTGGFIGVDVFFVISGFLISTILFENLEHEQFSFIDFYARRIRRIFPALIFVLVSCFALGWFVLLPDEYKQLGKHMAGGAGFIQNFILQGEADYFDNAAVTKPLLHLWSLGIEEQFYIVWPVLLWIAYRLRANLLALTVLIALISFGLNIDGVKDNGTGTFYFPQTRFWELLIGASLAYLTLHPPALIKQLTLNGALSRSKIWANGCSALGLILLVLGFVLINKKSLFPGWWALLPTIGSVLILAAGPSAWINKTILSNKVLTWFGLISYPLYLWHWALLSFARIMEGQTPSEWMRAALVLLSIVLSALTYYLIEKPIRFGKHLKTKTIILIILMSIVGAIGYNTYKREGLGFRMPAEILALSAYRPTLQREKHYEAWYRFQCFLDENQNFSDFLKCEEIEKRNSLESKPVIAIWGDSHAASFAPGFRHVLNQQYNIYQRTTALCPPILGFIKHDRPNCKGINDEVFSYIVKSKPQLVVLSAWWGDYDWQAIQQTIQRLQSSGIENILLIGPLPQWHDHLPNLIFRQFNTDPLKQIPTRLSTGLKTDNAYIDDQLALIAKEKNIRYFSPKTVLCNQEGCLTIIGNAPKHIVAFDTTHLTTDGAQYLVLQIRDLMRDLQK